MFYLSKMSNALNRLISIIKKVFIHNNNDLIQELEKIDPSRRKLYSSIGQSEKFSRSYAIRMFDDPKKIKKYNP
jgi:hypothetical protein